MAKPMSASQFLAVLQGAGLRVEQVGAWRTWNRNGRGPFRRRWGPLHGVMIHHTASGEAGITEVCRKGHSGLPGPLCHGVIHKDGRVSVVGWGRANHAGAGDLRALVAVIRENSKHPRPGRGMIDGNARFVGFECVNLGDGKDLWPEAQLDAMARASAAVCRHYGWSEHSVIGHHEWTNQKIDPLGFTMESFRRRVSTLL